MIGVITGWDVLGHPVSTIRCFGWRVFFRAVLPQHEQTFLSLLQDAGFFQEDTSQAPMILDRCIGLELRAKGIYEALARRFTEQRPVELFFTELAVQEQQHADLLRVCRSIVLRSGWRAELFHPWQDHLPELEQHMAAAEAEAPKVTTVADAMRMTIQIEASEVNDMFRASLDASQSPFVKNLRPFRQATDFHIAYIVESISSIAPELLRECRELRAKFPQVHR